MTKLISCLGELQREKTIVYLKTDKEIVPRFFDVVFLQM